MTSEKKDEVGKTADRRHESRESEPLSPEEILEKIEKGEIQPEYVDEAPNTMTPESWEKFARGEITWSQLEGMTLEEAYAIAEIGYTYFENGKYKEARTIFEGLIIGNPYDAYFHSMLGAIFAKTGLVEEATEEYSQAIELDPDNISARVNRGELLIQHGEFEYAMVDLKAAIELDPEGKDPSGIRARALAVTTAAMIESALKEEG